MNKNSLASIHLTHLTGTTCTCICKCIHMHVFYKSPKIDNFRRNVNETSQDEVISLPWVTLPSLNLYTSVPSDAWQSTRMLFPRYCSRRPWAVVANALHSPAKWKPLAAHLRYSNNNKNLGLPRFHLSAAVDRRQANFSHTHPRCHAAVSSNCSKPASKRRNVCSLSSNHKWGFFLCTH